MSTAQGAQGSGQEGAESVDVPSVLLPYKEPTSHEGPDLSNHPSSSSLNPGANSTTSSETKDPSQSESKPKKKPRPSTKSSGDGSSSRRNASSRSDPTKGAQWDASYHTSINAGLIGTASSDVPPPGWLPAGGGARKLLPEMAMPFNLPSITRHLADNSLTQGQGQETASAALDSDEEEDSDFSSSEEDGDSDTSTSSASSSGQSSQSTHSQSSSSLRRKQRLARQQDRNLIYIQSLRQSRLFYLSSFLPVFSHRLRNGHYYFPDTVPRKHLHGLNPAHTDEYVLAPLGQVDLQCGPHLFHQTNIWEMRRGRAVPDVNPSLTMPVKAPKSRTAQKEKGSPQSQKKSATSTDALPPTSEQGSVAPPATSSATPKTVPSEQMSPATASQPRPAPPSPPTTSTAGAHSPPVSTSSRPSPSTATVPSSQPTSPPPAAVAAVDPLLVTRVNARAAHSPQLRDLLQVAARGQASSEQLRILGIVIQQVTQEMEAEGIKVKGPQTPRAQSPAGPSPRPPPAKPAVPASTSSQSKSADSESPKGPKKGKAKASAKQSAQSEAGQTKPAAKPRKSNANKEKKAKAEQSKSNAPEQDKSNAPEQSNNTTPEQNNNPGHVRSAEATQAPAPSSEKPEAASKKKQKAKASVDAQSKSAADASLQQGANEGATAELTSSDAATTTVESPKPAAAPSTDAKKPRKSGAATSHPRIKGVPIISSSVPPPATRPPIIILEFAENPATLFYLPLWASLVERSKTSVPEKVEELSLDFDDDQANLRARREEVEVRLNVLTPETGNLNNAKPNAEEQGAAPQQTQSADVGQGHQPPGDITPAQPASQAGPGSKYVRRETRGGFSPGIQGVEPDAEAQYVFSMAMRSSSNLEALWDVFGRAPGVRSFEADGREVPSPEAPAPNTSDGQSLASAQPSGDKMDQEQADVQESVKTDAQPTEAEQVAQLREVVAQALARLPARRYLDVDERPPNGLADHLTDQFAPTVVPLQDTLLSSGSADRNTTTGRRNYRRRQNAAVPSARDFALQPGPTTEASSAPSLTTSQAGVKRDIDSALPMGLPPDSMSHSQEPAKKKRSVATHNPDGSLKLCEHCRASYPPMWRRGPNGPGTLCNACGSRYKAGRLVLAAGGGLTSIAPAPRGGRKG